ncbi:unnamed protein product [Leptidea sinapis]|uniref:Uncharacterized protein n=1 Tax=Leptidea sinapis TaxID=189913 RepID=A0A5E4QFC5_9NEOP|nr:unnamed protein product [Leptidea sinapis]
MFELSLLPKSQNASGSIVFVCNCLRQLDNTPYFGINRVPNKSELSDKCTNYVSLRHQTDQETGERIQLQDKEKDSKHQQEHTERSEQYFQSF